MYRMMIVDDEEHIANSIYDLMDERFDFELYRCYSAMAALDVIRTMRFDIVITDIAMPGMSGLELLNKVQAIWPKCHFLILTAYDSFDYAYETLRHDRVDYLLKIESYDTICQCVERKLQDIQKERSREEKLRHYDQYVQQVGESMGRYFLKRIIVQGIPLPDQHDLDQFSVPLRLEQPVMLVFLALNDQNPVTNNRTSMDILQSIQARFQAYDIPFLSYLSTGTILLVIQPGGESNLAGDRITLCADGAGESAPNRRRRNRPQAGHSLRGRADSVAAGSYAVPAGSGAAGRHPQRKRHDGAGHGGGAAPFGWGAFLPQHGRIEHALGNGEMRQH